MLNAVLQKFNHSLDIYICISLSNPKTRALVKVMYQSVQVCA